MDIRSVMPSQLIAESGCDVVVINLGSANLRIGVATSQTPVVVPHCIAHKVFGDDMGEQRRKKGSVAEQGFSASLMSAARRAERDEVCEMVALQLKMKPFTLDSEGSAKAGGEGWTSIQLNEDESFQWTQVMVANPAFKNDKSLSSPSIIRNAVGEDGSGGRPQVEVSELASCKEHEQEVFEADNQKDPEQEISKELNDENEREPEEEIAEDSEEEIAKGPEEEFVEDSEEETGKEPEEEIVDNSEEEPQKEAEQDVIDDSEEDGQKGPMEEIAEDSEEETRKENGEVFEQVTPGESEQDTPPEPEPEIHEGSDLDIHVEVRVEAEEPLKSEVHARLQQQVENPFKYRSHICGEEALNIAVWEPYILRRPICRGHLHVTEQYSLQQVCDDLYSIWEWVLTEKLFLDARTREQYSAVLVVPDTMDNREIKELLSVVLRDLRFRSAVVHQVVLKHSFSHYLAPERINIAQVHCFDRTSFGISFLQESVAATFGNGISTACVVNMGAQVTSVACVEDGVVLPASRIVLPFGGEDISRCLLWVQQRWQTWPPIDTDPLHDPLDLHTLERIKEAYCLIIEGEQRAVVEIPYHEAGRLTRVYKGCLRALNVPVMGLFYPSLLAPEEYAAPLRPGFHTDHEDVLDDSFHEPTRKSDVAEVVLPGTNGGGSSVAGSEVGADDNTGGAGLGVEESTIGLSQAIVNSILSAGRPDLQKKLFASIQLVGGTAHLRGLVDAVEERVLHAIPVHETVDTVAVLHNRIESPVTCWKGGAVLGILDFSRDAWVNRDDWVTGGVRLGYGRKYKDSFTLHSQAFYYSAVVE